MATGHATERTPILIGIDFDNTLIDYDGVFQALAVKRGLFEPPGMVGKKALRDRLRSLPNGEIEWQKLQAAAYGPLIHQARCFPGALDFIRCCLRLGWQVVIVSHKTEWASQDNGGVSLHRAALDWLAANGFFAGGLLNPAQVFFEPTRSAKIERVRRLGCRLFIDDLEETFAMADFPAGIDKFLFNPHGEPGRQGDLQVCSSWAELTRLICHG